MERVKLKNVIAMLLNSGRGFSVDLLNRLSVVSCKDGTFAVWLWQESPWGDIEKEWIFDTAEEASEHFLKMCGEMNLGFDEDLSSCCSKMATLHPLGDFMPVLQEASKLEPPFDAVALKALDTIKSQARSKMEEWLQNVIPEGNSRARSEKKEG